MSGRRVLLAGATGQVGRVVAAALASGGHRVAVHCHRRRDIAERVVTELEGADHAVVQVDLADADAVDAELRRLGSAWGPVDDLVNAAWPSTLVGSVADVAAADVDAAFIGVGMHVNLCRAVLPTVRRSRGAVVLLGGALSTRLHPRLGLFGAAKAAATVLTHTLALEEGPAGVRANVISPGRIATATDDLAEDDPDFAALDRIGALRRSLPLPTPADVAATVTWLLSPAATAITGQTITLAGGERV